MTLTRRERIMIIAGLAIVAVAAYVFYFLIPYFNNTNDATSRYTNAEAQLNVLKLKANNLQQLRDENAELEGKLKSLGASIPEGTDHARILLYLEDLTKGRAVDVRIQMAADQEARDGFLLQHVTVEFRTQYPVFLKMMDDLKKNKLYSKVAYLKVDYAPNPDSYLATADTAAATESPSTTESSAATATPALTEETEITEYTTSPSPAPTTDPNVITVHLELSFYAFRPAESATPELPLPPRNEDRENSLFPEK